MLGVCDRITDDLERKVSTELQARTDNTNILQKDLENTTRLLVDQTRDTLDTTSASETTDGRLCDALDVVAEDLAVAFRAALSETLRKRWSATAETRKNISNTPFHPFHGQTLL